MTLTAGGAVYLGAVNHSIERADLLRSSAEAKAAVPKSAKGALNIVILGSASQNAGNSDTGRGDVVMMLHISQDRKSAQLISFPRATYVKVAGHGMQTLNKTYALGGTKLTVSTLQQLTKTRVDHVMLADYEGFAALTQQVGAVTVDNETAFSNQGYSFAKGSITLSGAEALAYVKARADGEDAEGDKEERQRAVLEAGLKQGLNRDMLSSPTRLAKFVNTATSNMTVDKSLTGGAITKIATSLRLKEDDVQLVRAPLSDDVKTVDGQEVQEVDAQQFKEFASALSSDKVGGYTDKHGSE